MGGEEWGGVGGRGGLERLVHRADEGWMDGRWGVGAGPEARRPPRTPGSESQSVMGR